MSHLPALTVHPEGSKLLKLDALDRLGLKQKKLAIHKLKSAGPTPEPPGTP